MNTSPVYARCNYCGKTNLKLPEVKFSRNRLIWFCSRDHLFQYIEKNKYTPEKSIAEEIATRANIRLNEIQQELLFINHNSHEAIINESLIYELTYLIEGRERVTKQERYPAQMVVSSQRV